MQVLKEALKKLEELPSFHSVQLRLKVSDETQITPALKEVAGQVGSSVSVGSYPVCQKASTKSVFCSTLLKELKSIRLLYPGKIADLECSKAVATPQNIIGCAQVGHPKRKVALIENIVLHLSITWIAVDIFPPETGKAFC